MGRPALKREIVQYIVEHYGLNLLRACKLIKQRRSVQYYRSVKDPKLALRQRMRELAQVRIRYGYRRLHVLLKREGGSLERTRHLGSTAWSNCSCVPGCQGAAI